MTHKLAAKAATAVLGPLMAFALAAPAAASQQNAARHAAAAVRAGHVRLPRPGPSALAGYVWSTSTAPSGPIDGYYAFNSSGAAVTVAKQFPGTYSVTFDGLGAVIGPAIDVTPYGAAVTCNPVLQGANAGNFGVTVECFSLSGAPVDARFDLAITKPTAAPRGVLDFDTVGRHYGRLTGPFQYNSSHKTNSVKHLGAGRYRVTMPGPATTGTTGTVQLSDDSVTGGGCEVAGWHGTRAGQVINVDCFSAAGARHDEVFCITYARGNNLLGLNGATTANALANRPATARYQPSVQYDSHRHARVIAVRLQKGAYQVFFRGSEGPGTINGGDVQVSAVGHTDDHCYVLYWAQQTEPYARVNCVTNLGSPADSAFTIQWIVA